MIDIIDSPLWSQYKTNPVVLGGRTTEINTTQF